MNYQKYFFLLTLLLLLSCNKYKGDFTKINFIGFENLVSEKKKDCLIEFTNKKGFKTIKAKAKFRGGYSAVFNKKNFSISLKKSYEFKGLPKNKEWVLNASFIDKTFLRNVLNYHLFRNFNKDNKAPKTKYAEVFVEDKYYGFYIVSEKIDKSRLELKSKYALIFKDPTVYRKPDSTIDYTLRFTGNYYHQKFPKDTSFHYELDSLKNFILFASDSLFEAKIFNIVSKRNLIDWHILLMLSNGGDGVKKNFFLYRKSPNKKFKIAIWDCDHSFGRDGDNELNMLERKVNVKDNILIKRLLENSNLNYQKAVSKRWKKLRNKKKIDAEKLKAFIDFEAQKIRPFVKRNFQKWSIKGWPYNDENDFEQEIQILKEYIDLRIPELDSLFSN